VVSLELPGWPSEDLGGQDQLLELRKQMRVEHGVELTEVERGMPALHVEEHRERNVATGRDDRRIGARELRASSIDESSPDRADRRRVADDLLGRRQRLLTGCVLVGIPRKDAGLPRDRQQLERVEDVDGEIAQRAATCRSRLREILGGDQADPGEPGVENDERVAGKVRRRERRPGRETEGSGELGDVEDRLDDTIDRDRRNDREAGRFPAASTLGAVADVDRLPVER